MFTKSQLKTIILDQQTIYKLPKLYIQRELENQMLLQKHDEISIITGFRRVGKSTLLLKIKEALGGDYFVNFDDERFRNFTVNDFQKLYEVLLELFGNQPNFYFDEIQNIKGWERFVRRLYDMGKKIFITGSNANLLSVDLGTHLTGRYISYTLYPLSFNEFLRFNQLELNVERMNTEQKVNALKSLTKYLTIGGIPKYVINPQSHYLKELVDNVIYRDIVTKYNIKHVASLNYLVQYAFSNFSRLISARKLTSIIGVKNHSTVMEYLKYLQDAYLIFLVPKYSYSLKQQLIAPKKLYVIDLALAQNYGFWFSDDLGHKLENIVFLHLNANRNKIFYFRDNFSECDFIIHKEGKVIKAIQVTANLTNTNEKSEINGLLKALKHFNLKQGTIITLDQEDQLTKNGLTIDIVPIYKWLLAERFSPDFVHQLDKT